MAIPVALISAAIAAAAAIASGVASGAQGADAAKRNAQESQADADLRERMQKQQLLQQQQQFQQGQLASANQGLEAQLQGGAQQATALAADRAATRDDLRGNLSRAYLRKA